jgi:hypothetical protein
MDGLSVLLICIACCIAHVQQSAAAAASIAKAYSRSR